VALNTSMSTHTSSDRPIENVKACIHIIGAGRGIGRWFADVLFNQHQHLYCYDTDAKSLDKIPLTKNPRHIESLDNLACHSEYLMRGGIYILAIPEDSISMMASQLIRFVPPESVFVTASSVQSAAIASLRDLNLPVAPMGLHPLFGPTVQSAVAQHVIITNYDHSAPLHAYVCEYLQSSGLIVCHLSPEAHDAHMSIVQALTHFCFLCFASVLAADNPGADHSILSLRTPNFQFLHAFTCRFLSISSHTTGSIQFASGARLLRERFIAEAQRLNFELSSAPDIKAAALVIDSVRKPFDGAHIDEGVQAAAVAVDGIQRFERLIFQYKKTKEIFLFRHRVTQAVHAVRILEIHSTQIKCSEATQQVGGMHIFTNNEIAQANYSRMGINVAKSSEQTFKKRHITLLNSEEVSHFWKSEILLCTDRINAINFLKLPEAFFERRLPVLIPEVKECNFIEAYRKRNKEEKVTLELKFDPRIDLSELMSRCRNVIQNYHFGD
jgi:prephenate dehydrogenase